MQFDVVIPAHNVQDYLVSCLASLSAQTHGDWRAIVVDDASTDNMRAVAQHLAKDDERIQVIGLDTNAGTYAARKAGVSQCTGDYILFLDADDELKPTLLHELDLLLAGEPHDIVHFGMCAVCNGAGMEGEARHRGSLQPRLRPARRPRHRTRRIRGHRGTPTELERMGRAFNASLVKRAFAQMADERFTVAEDAYEYLVISGLAHVQLTRNNIIGYVYHIGRGGTSKESTREQLIDLARQYVRSSEFVSDWASRQASSELSSILANYRTELMIILANTWHDRIDEDAKLDAACELAALVGDGDTAAQLMRLAVHAQGARQHKPNDRM